MKTSLKWAAVAALFAGLTSGALAQTYSVNAVGYIKLVLPPGQTLVSTPFVKVGGGVPTITDMFGTNVPNRSTVYIYKPANGIYDTYNFSGGEWKTNGVFAGSNLIHRGSGVWFKNPATTNITLNLVGEVPGGEDYATEQVSLPSGTAIFSFSFPNTVAFEESGLVPNNRDTIYDWNGAIYITYTYSSSAGKWRVDGVDTPLVFQPGKGYWYKTATGKVWTQPKLYTWP
jgi:hypothetical protein